MQEWQLCQLGDIIELKRGYDLSKQARISGSVPLVSSSGISDYISEAKVDAPGVITGRYGTIGQVFYLDEPFWPLNTTLYVRDFKGNDPRFVSYFLSQIDFMAYSDKAAVPGINRNHVHQAIVNLPPVSEQRAIASALSALDDKIELNRRMNDTLEASARALFRDWFVDFGPTRAKMEGRPAYLDPNLWPLFPDCLDAAGKPEGWEWRNLGEHVLNFDSKRVPVSNTERAKRQGPYPYHGATSVMDFVDDFLFDGIYVLVGEDGSVAKESGHAFTQYVSGKIWVNNHAHVLQGKGAVSTEQVLLFFQHEPVLPFITGAVQLKLSQGRMNSMPFIDAGEAVCSEFGKLIDPFFNRIRVNERESRTLAEFRDLLLPKLMSGEIRVRDAEKMVGNNL